jgi:hypothetical protein
MRVLHVANGTSTTDIIRAAGIAGASSIWADPLHEGPVPGGLSDGELVAVRARHLAEPTGRAEAAIVADLNRWRAAIDRHELYEELVLWFEHDLFDQLNLIQLLTRIRDCVPATKPVSLICIGSFPGRDRFKGLGELTCDELASLLETRQRVSEAQLELARRAWAAFRAADPQPLETLLRSDTSALPFLAHALWRHLAEFPWIGDGLSRSERRVLQVAETGPIDLRTAFPRMHDDETCFYIADLSFWNLVEGLSRTSPPLLMLEVSSRPEDRLPDGTLTLTGTGRAVLAGAADRVKHCGVDRWLGGVQLQGTGAVWRWDDAGARMVWS